MVLRRFAPGIVALSVLLFLWAHLSMWAQTSVTLSPVSTPSSGQAGVTNIIVTGSNFPSGTIPPQNVTVMLAPATPGTGPTVSTPASGVQTLVGTTRRVTFQIPATATVTSPTSYRVSLSGSTSTGVQFVSANSAALTVNPPASIQSLTPVSARPGEMLQVNIVGQSTNYVQGSTQASFGEGIAVGQGMPGGFGFVVVNSPTTATAQLTVNSSATGGPRTVAVRTGVQQASLVDGFTIRVARVTTVVPNLRQQGQSLSVTVTGENTSFSAGMSQVSLGAGISVGKVAVSSATSLTADVTIAANAAVGARTVTVTTGSETVALADGFNVTEAPPEPPTTLTLGITDPLEGAVVPASPITVRGAVSDSRARVVVQNVLASVSGTAFEARNVILSEGPNELSVRATTPFGAQAGATRTVTLDTITPALTIFSPPERSIITAATVNVSGTASDATAISCSINGSPIVINGGVFSSSVALVGGRNEVSTVCLDAAGNSSTRLLTLFQDTQPLVPSGIEPTDGSIGVSTTDPVEITFSKPVDPSSVTSATVYMRAGDTILPASVTVSPDGLAAILTPLVPLPPGATILVTVTGGIRDVNGNPIAVPFVTEFITAGAPVAPGVVIGEVFDDTRSLPLAGATVEAIDPATREILATTESDHRGKYLLNPGRSPVLVRITKAGFTSAERVAVSSQNSFAEAADARLTPRAGSQTVAMALGGQLVSQLGDVLTIAPGTFVMDANASLTAVSGQGPMAPFPAGWTPLGVVDFDGPEDINLPATLQIADRTQKAGGRSGVVARYDTAARAWVALAEVVVPSGTKVQLTTVVEPGQFALLIPDEGEGAPTAVTIGAALPAGTAGAVPVDAVATGKVEPAAGRADDPTPAAAAVTITHTSPLRSGTPLRGDFMELVMLRNGGHVAPLNTSQDFVAYREPADISGVTLGASFPIAPSRVFGPGEVSEGSIVVNVSRGVAAGRSVIGATGGGARSSDGSRVIAPPGAFMTDVPIALRRLDISTFPIPAPAGLTFLGGLDVDISSAVSTSPLVLSLGGAAGAVPTGATVLVAEVRNISGVERLALAAEAQVDGNDLTTITRVGGVDLPGVRQTGRYGFFLYNGLLELVSGTARDTAGRFDGHAVELRALPLVSVTALDGRFHLVSAAGPFDLVATSAANGDQAFVSGNTGTPLAEIVIGPTPPRVQEILVRLPKLEGNFAGPVSLLGKPAPVVDDDAAAGSSGNGNGVVEAGETIDLTLFVRNDGTVPVTGGFFMLGVRGPTGALQVEPANIPLDTLPVDEPFAVDPFRFVAPGGIDPASLRYTLIYANEGGLSNVIPFLLPLGVEHPNVLPGSEITIRFSEPVVRSSLSGRVTLTREDGATQTPVAANVIFNSDSTSLILRPLASLADDTVYRITLEPGIVDHDGLSLQGAPYTERMRTIDRTPPALIPPGQIEMLVPDADGLIRITGSPGSVNPDDTVIGLNQTTGFTALADVSSDGSFSVTVRADVTDEIAVLVRDRNDNTTTIDPGPFVRRDAAGNILSAVIGRSGGQFATADGVRLIVPAGAVNSGTELSVSRLATPFELPTDIAADPAVVAAFGTLFSPADRLRITSNVTRFRGPVKLSLPAPAGAAVGDLYLVVRSRTVTFGGPLADMDRRIGIPLAQNPFVTAERLEILESATVKEENGQLILSTDSPPFPGIASSGDLTLLRVNSSLVFWAGEVRRDSVTGPLAPGIVVRSLPDAAATSPFAAVTDSEGKFIVADASLNSSFAPGTALSGRLDAFDAEFRRVIRRDVRGVVGPPSPPQTVIAHLDEPFVLPTKLPSDIVDDIGDVDPPTLELVFSGPTFRDGFSAVGAPLTVTLQASDNDELASVGLELDQGSGFQPVSLMANRTVEITPTSPNLLVFRGNARDRTGNETFRDGRVRIVVATGGAGGGVVADDDIIDDPVHPPELVAFECPRFDGAFEAQFSEPMNRGSITTASLQVLDPEGISVQFTTRFGSKDSRIIIVPQRYLRLGAKYRVVMTNGLTDVGGQSFRGETRDCEVQAPRPTRIIDVNNVEDVALVGDTLLAINHPDGSSPGDDGALHAFQVTFNENGEVDDGGVVRLSTTPLSGRPLSLATDGTTAFVGNRFLGSMTLSQPFIGIAVFPFGPLPTADAIFGCSTASVFGVSVLETSLPLNPEQPLDQTFTSTTLPFGPQHFLGADPTNICLTLTQFWNYPKPASNLSVHDLSDPRNPTRLGGIALNALPPDFVTPANILWYPNTWPDRVEITGDRVAVQSFASNLEFLTVAPQPERLGIVGQVRRLTEISHRGPDGKLGTADDHDNEFYDAAYFPEPLSALAPQVEGFAVTIVRDGIRIMPTAPLLPQEQNSREITFVPIPGTHGGRLGGVPEFQWGGDDGTQFTSHLAFLATTDNTLHIIDVTNPAAPSLLGGLTGTFGNMSFDACRGLAYLHGRNGAIHIIDFNNPSAPIELNNPGSDRDKFRFDDLGSRVSFNGNVNRNGVVYFVGENRVGGLSLGVTSEFRHPNRQACQLRLIPSRAIVPVGGTQAFAASPGGQAYVFNLEADSSGGATLLANGNGTATYRAGPNPGSSVVQVELFNSPGVVASAPVSIADVRFDVPGLTDRLTGACLASPSCKTDIGAFVGINADNDNESQVKDRIPERRDFDSSATDYLDPFRENDLRMFEIVVRAGDAEGDIFLRFALTTDARARLKVWDSPWKENLILSTERGNLPAIIPLSSLPNLAGSPLDRRAQYFIEGTREGQAEREISLILELRDEHGALVDNDILKVTVTPVLRDVRATATAAMSPDIVRRVYSDGTADWQLYSDSSLIGKAFDLSAEALATNIKGVPCSTNGTTDCGLRLVQNVHIVNGFGNFGAYHSTTGEVKRRDFEGQQGTIRVDSLNEIPFYTGAPPPDLTSEKRFRNGSSVFVTAGDTPTLALSRRGSEAAQVLCTWSQQEDCVLPDNGERVLINVSYRFLLYVVWQFDDGTIYVLGSTNWSVGFAGSVVRAGLLAAGQVSYGFQADRPNNYNRGSQIDPATNRSFEWDNELPPVLGPPTADGSPRAWIRP